jgi:hypothetical protein
MIDIDNIVKTLETMLFIPINYANIPDKNRWELLDIWYRVVRGKDKRISPEEIKFINDTKNLLGV